MSNCDCPDCRARRKSPSAGDEALDEVVELRRTIADAIEALLAEPACNPDEYAYRAAHWETTAKIARRMLGRVLSGLTEEQHRAIVDGMITPGKLPSRSTWTRYAQPDSAALMVGCHTPDCSENARWKSSRNEFACDVHAPDGAKRAAP